MNERIRELAKSVQCERHWTEEDIEKFAELIVQKCVEIAQRTGELNEADFEGEMIADAIKEQFGVKL